MTDDAKPAADDAFWEALAVKYADHAVWASERDEIKRTFEAIREGLADLYSPDIPLNVGGGGIAIRVVDLRLSTADEQVYAVLKMPRPVTGQAREINEILQRETEQLRTLRHQNLIRILTYGSTLEGTHYYVMEYLDRPLDADEFLKRSPNLETLIVVLSSACAGIAYMHHMNVAHLDLKPANIFVAAEGASIVIADLGFAKKTTKNGETQYLGGTAGYKHPDHDRLISAASASQLDVADPNRQLRKSEVLSSDIKTEWDIYSLGVTALVLLRVLERHDPRVTGDYRYRYIKLMAYRMLGANVTYAAATTELIHEYGSRDETALPLVEEQYLGLQRDAFKQLKYETMDTIVDDLRKLVGSSDLLRSVPELSIQPRDVIQAASHGSVPFTARIREVLETHEVRALGRVDQLGLVRMVYPSATHSRLEHSLGTLAMATRFARALLSDPISPIFRQLMTEDDIAKLLVICLVHDIGHYPLAHDLEETDREVFGHERRTSQLLLAQGSEVRRVLTDSELGWAIDTKELTRILDADASRIPLKDMIIRSVIDGPIDADKLDYLLRDSENLRLPYGRGMDLDKLMQCLTVVVDDPGNGTEARIGIHDKGRIPAESVAFARYAMYGSVYWHRTHRTLKAMLNRLGMEVMFQAKSGEGHYLERLRNDLYAFLDAEDSSQLLLELEEQPDSRPSSPYLDAATQRMVWWLASKVPDESFEELAEAVLFRRLYKRVLVVSRSRSGASKTDWAQLDKIFGRIGRNWDLRREATTVLQERLVQLVRDSDGDVVPGISKISINERERFLAEAASDAPLVLIDYPPVKSGSAVSLEYLRESEWSQDGRVSLRVDHVEPSSMWNALIDQYSEALGKVRVYVHPDHAGVVQATVKREVLEKALWGALRSVRT